MIKSRKLVLITVFAFIAAMCLFAGCKLNSTLDDILDKYDLTARVTYFLNGGQFEDKTQIKEMYYSAGTMPYDISVNRPNSGSAQLDDKHGSVFTGWYAVKLSDDGNPLYNDSSEYVEGEKFDPAKGIQMAEELFDFSIELKEGDHYFVCGDWIEVPKLLINLALEDCDSLTDAMGNEYKPGDTINETYITGDVYFPGRNLLDTNDYTFIAYYLDENCETPVEWPLVAPEDNEEDLTIYAKYIKGKWTIVENTTGITTMFSSSGGSGNYYLLNDIDCSSLTVNYRSTFSGKIRGNGYKILNLTVTSSSMLAQNAFASVFGTIRSSAEITDVSFENLTAKFSVRSNVWASVYLVCRSIEDGAKISNFTVGGKLDITLGENSYLNNGSEDTWLFGGFDSDGDCTSIKVSSGTTCTINNYDGTKTTYTHTES